MSQRSSELIKEEIISKFGFFPPFFEPAMRSPGVLENLWQQTRLAYVENIIPNLFKEKLAAMLARYCTVPYCLICHSSALRPLGMTASQVLEILELPALTYSQLAEKTKCLDVERLPHWPKENSHLEECVLYCSVAIFLGEDTEECQDKLRNLLPDELFDNLISFISYNRTALAWAEAHPELNFKDDKRFQDHYAQLVTEEPGLKDFFANYQGRVRKQSERRLRWLTEENRTLMAKERELRSAVENERARLLDIFENMQGPVAMLSGPNHIFRYTNARYREMFLGGRHFEGRSVAEALPQAKDQGFIDLLDQVRNTGVSYVGTEARFEYLNSAGAKSIAFFNFVYEAVKNSAGVTEGVLAAITDVTEQVLQRKQLIKAAQDISIERRKLNLIINEAPIGVALMTGPELRFEIANQQWQALVPDQREYLGRRYDEIYPELKQTGLSKIIENVFKTGETFTAYEMLVPVKRASGEMEDRYYDFSYMRMTDASSVPSGVFSVAANVTERVRNKHELADAKIEADRANLSKSAFLANMSHEIRTPLGAILGFTDLLKDARLTGEEREYLNVISRNGAALSHVIDDILDLSKVEAGQLTIESIQFDLKTLAKDVVTLFSDTARSKELTLKFESDIPNNILIMSDPIRIRQVLVNLIGNAIKFTTSGSVAVVLSASAESADRRTFELRVRDTGRGISPDQVRKLFQPFVQADDSTTRTYGGTGLGLAISRRLANALGGDVEIEESELDKGSIFLFKFSAAVAEKSLLEVVQLTTPRSQNGGMKLLSSCRVLIVDDSPDNRVLLNLFLRREGATVDEASSGDEAIKKVSNNDYDIVLMDIQMPGMDGYTALAAIQKNGYTKPVLALTAHAMVEEKRRALSAGFVAHVTKPVVPAELVRVIREHAKYKARIER